MCYVPEYETVEDTRLKLQDRRRYVIRAVQIKGTLLQLYSFTFIALLCRINEISTAYEKPGCNKSIGLKFFKCCRYIIVSVFFMTNKHELLLIMCFFPSNIVTKQEKGNRSRLQMRSSQHQKQPPHQGQSPPDMIKPLTMITQGRLQTSAIIQAFLYCHYLPRNIITMDIKINMRLCQWRIKWGHYIMPSLTQNSSKHRVQAPARLLQTETQNTN